MKMTIATKRNIKHIAILVGIFFAAIIFFYLIGGNKGTTDLTVEMSDATYPVVSFYAGDQVINQTYGYKEEMDETSVRDSITPVDSDLQMPITIDTNGTTVTGISYEVRSLDAERLVEDTTLDTFNSQSGQVSATLNLQNLLDSDTEYLLILKVESKSQTYYYYTRIIKSSDDSATQALDFVSNFHDETLGASDGSDLATYIEPDSTQTNTTLQYVNIHSSLSQIMWGNFDPEVVSDVNVTVAETNSSYTSVVLTYTVSSADSQGVDRYYNVKEYYRVRVTSDRMYLLDFERETDQVFTGTGDSFYDNYIQLGITDTDVNYKASDSGTIVAFVQQGDLWSYNQESEEITKVFSFRGSDITDSRENNTDHDIKILNIDESGSIEFVVYGYMSRGQHEGQVGVGVYRYDSDTNVVEEELFVDSDESYEVMKEEIGDLFYVSSNNIFYMMTDGMLYSVDMTDGTLNTLEEGMDSNTFVVSDSGQFIAWVEDSDKYSSTSIHVMNLDTEEITQITAGDGQYIQPLGYLEEDFVYGIANQSDVVQDVAGNITFPMNSVEILDDQLQEVKDYSVDGYYVVSAYESENALHLKRVTKSGDEYLSASEDTIINYSQNETDYNTVNTTETTDAEQTQVQISMAADIENLSPRMVTPQEVLSENENDISVLKGSQKMEQYYVYKGCQVVLSTQVLSDAINEAYSDGGVVVDSNQNYIWTKNKKTSAAISDLSVPDSAANANSVAKCIDAILNKEEISNNAESYLQQGTGIFDVMTNIMSDNIIVDLTGCTVEEVLYYISQGNPVIAMEDSENAVLFTGYDSYNVTVFDPETQTTSKIGLEDCETQFAAAGSIYIGYLK